MAVIQLYNTPTDPASTAFWLFANADSHEQMIAATLRQKGLSLTRYVLEPVSMDSFEEFKIQHQQAHNDLFSVWGIGGNDYSDWDPNDPESFAQVVFLHASDHNLLHQAMGI